MFRYPLKNKIKRKKAVLILSIIVSCLVGCGQQKVAYKDVTDIKGITFQIPFATIVNGTAISKITNDMDFDRKTTYVYKDGKSQFILFNMENITIVAQKNTDFNFEESETTEKAIEKGNILGIRFTPYKENGTYSKGEKKFSGKVNAGVVITEEIYDDFTGNLVVLKNGNQEWAIFAGVPTKKYESISKDISKALNRITESVTVTKQSEEQRETETLKTSERANTQKKKELQTEQQNKNISKNDITEDMLQKQKPTMQFSNQTKIAGKEETAYDSSIYQLLDIGQKGKVNIFDRQTQKYQTVTIEIKQVYTGEEAEKIIRKYCQKNSYEYQAASEGMSWHMIQYDIDQGSMKTLPYLNISLKGLDGNNLNYRGIKYASTSYDIFTERKIKEKKTTENYCFYAVPNGCEEYILQCSGMSNDEKNSAYFAVSLQYHT